MQRFAECVSSEEHAVFSNAANINMRQRQGFII